MDVLLPRLFKQVESLTLFDDPDMRLIILNHASERACHELPMPLHEFLILQVELLLGPICFLIAFFRDVGVDALDFVEVL